MPLTKILFPKQKLTKADVVTYYENIAPYLLPYLKNRPEDLNRHPNGIDKKHFFQKNISHDVPLFAKMISIHAQSTDHDVHYLVCNNAQTLMYMVHLDCIEINPWSSRTNNLHKPDYLVIDIDPDGNSWAQIVRATRAVQKILNSFGLISYIKTSGKRGVHIFVPAKARYDFETIRTWAHTIVTLACAKEPQLLSIERHPAKRRGKIYLDYLQNSIGQTLAAPYSLRPTPNVTVSTPFLWSELSSKKDLRKTNYKTIFKRLETYGDIWKPIFTEKNDFRTLSAFSKNMK